MRWFLVVCLMSMFAQAQQSLPVPPVGQVYCANMGHFVCRDWRGREVDLTKAFDDMEKPKAQPLPLFSEIPMVIDCYDCKSSEPVDVPAVKRTVKDTRYPPQPVCWEREMSMMWYSDGSGIYQYSRRPADISNCDGRLPKGYKVSWSCDDKDRVLLPPDGRGRRWCHRLEKE